ncbi:unnamed protein product [Tilletia caries]|uniref:Uncharacterized protein n=1 Tax=Tilletia caries TaxID=13290 RepID=A0ABN7IRW2_9BASI|nr:unnamed protein product [Tilletia caries]
MSSTAVSSTGGEGTDGEVDDTVPSRPLSSFEHPELMLWNYEDAKTMKDAFSRVDCTRNPDGTCVKKVQITRLSKAVTFACAFLFDMDIHEYLEGSVRNYRFFRENYMHLLLGIAKSLEEKFPVLSWCTLHYKALKWIEYHLKQHNEQIAKKKRLVASAATAAASSSSASTSHPSSSTSNSTGQHGKNRKTKRAADVDLKPAKTSKKLKKKHPLNEIDDNMFSEDDDDESAVHSSILTTKPKAKLVVHNVGSIPEDGNTSTKPATASSAAAPIPKQKIQIPGRVDSSIHASSSAVTTSAPSARQDLVLPTLKAASSSTASTMAEKIEQFQKAATETSIGTTVEEIRAALPRFGSLGEIDLALDSDPLVHNHIKQVCDNIQQAFKAPSSQKAKAPESAVDRAATGSKEASSSSDGKVYESRLRRLGKKLSIPLLKKAGIDVPSKANRNDVADMLVASWKSGKLNITAKQLQGIESGKQKAE